MQTILVIAHPAAAASVADALRDDLDIAVQLAPNRRDALSALRKTAFALVLMEESLATVDPEGADLLYDHAGAAPLLEINFAISSAPRVLRQVRSALARRAYDQATARAASIESLQNEIGASLTGILLESQLALRDATPAQAPKLQHLVDLAGSLRSILRS